jgi:hypothetical protein
MSQEITDLDATRMLRELERRKKALAIISEPAMSKLERVMLPLIVVGSACVCKAFVKMDPNLMVGLVFGVLMGFAYVPAAYLAPFGGGNHRVGDESEAVTTRVVYLEGLGPGVERDDSDLLPCRSVRREFHVEVQRLWRAAQGWRGDLLEVRSRSCRDARPELST